MKFELTSVFYLLFYLNKINVRVLMKTGIGFLLVNGVCRYVRIEKKLNKMTRPKL